MLDRVKRFPLRYLLWRVHNDSQLYKYIRQKYLELADPSNLWKLVLPKEKHLLVIRSFHCNPCSGHTRVNKTVARVGNRYHWPKLRVDVAKFVKYCEICIGTKPEQKPSAGHILSKTPTVDIPWSATASSRRSHAQSDATKNFSAKLAPKFMGLFTISKIVSPRTYEFKGCNGKGTIWHNKDLKAHLPDSN
ncbi:hypothetical protein NQ314_010717 [Rhamnusium bicolor]|uniref:Integrase zinc-binding domain-containing protein n=1 Tax=Rhamnusium bicolor TaxID=1586634 RepID=A0AAV8XPK1_9CUCU|nr:hypothetical protein NQ314_010717 [Rhamnusium bicolor]